MLYRMPMNSMYALILLSLESSSDTSTCHHLHENGTRLVTLVIGHAVSHGLSYVLLYRESQLAPRHFLLHSVWNSTTPFGP